VRAAIAARVAAQLDTDPDLHVALHKGRLGELRVSVDGTDVADSSRRWYPTPHSVVERVRRHVAASPPDC
jgi:hypothetical protein